MKQLSKRVVSIIGSLILVVVALLIFFELVQPEYNNVLQTKGQIVAEDGLYSTESTAVTAVQNIIAEYQKQQGSGSGGVDLALPNTQDIAGAVAQIYGLAENNGIVIQTIGISAPSIQGTNSSGGSTQSTVAPLGSFSLQINGAGTYENFKNFLSGIETNIRVFDVRSVSINSESQVGAAGKAATANSQDLFNYTLTVATYYQANNTNTN